MRRTIHFNALSDGRLRIYSADPTARDIVTLGLGDVKISGGHVAVTVDSRRKSVP